MRSLAAHQTHDPGRGSFLVRPRCIKGHATDRPVFIAPTEPNPNGDGFQTFSNAVEFQPIQGDN